MGEHKIEWQMQRLKQQREKRKQDWVERKSAQINEDNKFQ